MLSKSGPIEVPAEPLLDALNKLAVQIDVDIPYDLGKCAQVMISATEHLWRWNARVGSDAQDGSVGVAALRGRVLVR